MKIQETKPEDQFASTCTGVVSGILNVLLVVLTAVFPLYYEDAYFNIIQAKYRFYYLSILSAAIILFLVAAVMLFIDFKEFKGEHLKNIINRLRPANWKDTFSFADMAVLIYWLICAISTLQSEYVYESFWGNEGRYSGLFLITLYVFFYFIVTRLWRPNKWVLQLFLLSGIVMCVIGITDYFQMDILHFRVHIKPSQSAIFTSTLGNINTYTAYIALLLGFAASMFARAEKLLPLLWYYVCLIIFFFAIIMGCSDNAYLALGILFAGLPFCLFRTKQGVFRYLVIASSLVTVIQCIAWINQAYEAKVLGIDGLFNVLANIKGLPVIILILWGIVLAVYILWIPKKKACSEQEVFLNRKVVQGWFVFVAVCVAGLIVLLFDANVLGHGNRYGSLATYLVFGDHWGTDRGYIWQKSIDMYRSFPILHKLFGFGPDTFGIMTTRKFKYEMIEVTGQIFDNAHNEYLQLLLTIGPIGLTAYVIFVLKSCGSMLKVSAKNPMILGCAFAILCYFCQALVNLNLPIVAPMMWLMLSVGIAFTRYE